MVGDGNYTQRWTRKTVCFSVWNLYNCTHSFLSIKGDKTVAELMENYRYSVDNGILKVMSKMGIYTLQSYKGAQIFEILGLHSQVVER